MNEYVPREVITEYHKSIDAKLERIETKVDITDGRVGKLENWKNFINGGLAVLTALIIPILLILIKQYL